MSKNINPKYTQKDGLLNSSELSVENLTKGIRKGDRYMLSKAITLLESPLPEDILKSNELMAQCFEYSGNSRRIGITGSPGVGKSTFIDLLGSTLIEKGHSVAILAIDPSSTVHKGSILGDKTRMTKLSREEHVYIRPSASRGILGGIADHTYESIMLCEAAGYDVIMIETVGIGQSETMVKMLTDMVLLLLLPGGGDEIQGIKKGIVEMADMLIVNKADGNGKDNALKTLGDYSEALHLSDVSNGEWQIPAIALSSLTGIGIEECIDHIDAYFKLGLEMNIFELKRREQALFWYNNHIQTYLLNLMDQKEEIQLLKYKGKAKVENLKLSAYEAAQQFVNQIELKLKTR